MAGRAEGVGGRRIGKSTVTPISGCFMIRRARGEGYQALAPQKGGLLDGCE